LSHVVDNNANLSIAICENIGKQCGFACGGEGVLDTIVRDETKIQFWLSPTALTSTEETRYKCHWNTLLGLIGR
jgi:hypothetical protein